MREWESQGTTKENDISLNYKSIEWTKIRIEALHDLYEAAPLGAYLEHLRCSIHYCSHHDLIMTSQKII